jgi:hypothetical protein
LAVDCKSEAASAILTHHKGQATPPELTGDASTEIVLSALTFAAGDGHPVLHASTSVTTNHFDVDSFTCVWALGHPAAALAHADVLRRVSNIGDFRELRLEALEPCGVEDTALKLCCWLNSEERRLFYRPFDGGEAEGCLKKMAHFLPRFEQVWESKVSTVSCRWIALA